MAPLTLAIAIKAVERLQKEKALYKKDLLDQQLALESLKNNNADEILIKKQLEVYEETKKMIPEIDVKIEDHKKRLEILLNESYDDEESQKAMSMLE